MERTFAQLAKLIRIPERTRSKYFLSKYPAALFADFVRGKNGRSFVRCRRRKQLIKLAKNHWCWYTPVSRAPLNMPCLVRSSFHSFRIHRSTGNANFIDLSADLGRWFTVAIPVSRLRRYRVEEGIRDPMDGNVDRERLRSPASACTPSWVQRLGAGEGICVDSGDVCSFVAWKINGWN